MYYTERIHSLREDNDFNQTQIANAIHVAQTTYSDYEKGKVRIPVDCLIALAKFYNVDITIFVVSVIQRILSPQNNYICKKRLDLYQI